MLISETGSAKLGFPEILQYLSRFTSTDEGREFSLTIGPFRSEAAAITEWQLGKEALDLFMAGSVMPFGFSGAVRRMLAEAAIEGNWITQEDFLSLLKWMESALALRHWLASRKALCPGIWSRMEPEKSPAPLIQAISAVIDEKGNVRDSASPRLQQIRREMAEHSGRLRRELSKILRNAVSQGWTNEKEITFRNDRLVIPLNSDFKGRVPGFVHDVSQSGQTLYIEPADALEMNNALRKLAADEKAEIVRILTALTAQLRLELDSLQRLRKLLIRLDLLAAKAAFAHSLHATFPVLEPEGKELLILNGRHPLLLIKAEGKKDAVVPNTLGLSEDCRVMLISGPNAGGKTVALKLAGLLCLMVQCGLPVPCEDHSRFKWFTSIYVDIGDEQSIQSDLSTYTSHLAHLKQMWKGMSSEKLFLIDEFGSGTDPRMGGPIAEAFLEDFVQKGGYGIVSTHYGNLKTYAEQHPGICNAAMQFDPRNLVPTYVLQTGIAGSSYALEIARKAGVPEYILKNAADRMDQGQVNYEELLIRLEAQKRQLDAVLNENRQMNQDLKVLLEKNQVLKTDLEKNRNRILREAREEGQQILKEANRRIENTIREIREAQAEKERTRELRETLKTTVDELWTAGLPEVQAETEVQEEEIRIEKPGEKPEIGDWVKFRENENIGQVIELQGNRAVVSVGDLRVTAKLGQLIKIEMEAEPAFASRSGRVSVERMATIQHELNIMGLRVEQAIPILEKFLDDAFLAGLKEVRILHGKGTGALRTAVRDYLNTLPRVLSLGDAHADHGGPGWTVVELR